MGLCYHSFRVYDVKMHHIDGVTLELHSASADDNLFFNVRVKSRRFFGCTKHLRQDAVPTEYITLTTKYEYLAYGIGELYCMLRRNPRTTWKMGPHLPYDHAVVAERTI